MLQPESHLGTYRLISKLGAGGMGEVWKAEDTRLGRTVAIKILPPAIATDANAIARMKREARVAAQLYHPNIATIHAFEEAGDRLFIVMEFVDGEPLTQLIRRGPIPEADVCRIGRSIADALAEAHEKGIVHRDIKPDNIIVNGPRVKVLDFGIAKQVEPENVGANDPTTVLTQQGMIIGTVFYMSPEQALGKPLDPRTDLFSLGVVLYEAATGRRPFIGDSATDTITRIVRDEAPLPSGVSRGLAAIISRCLRKNREERYASARELAGALEGQLAVSPTAPYTRRSSEAAPTVIETSRPTAAPSSNRWLWIAVIALFVLAGALGAFILSQHRQHQVAATTTTTARAEPPATSSAGVTVEPEIVEVTTTTAAPAPAPAPAPPPPTTTIVAETTTTAPQRTADDDYDDGVRLLLLGRALLARQSFEAALAKDPRHARAHFRLGEIALFMRDFPTARRELNAAMADADRLQPRERKLTELGLALLDRNRERAETLIQEITAMSPRDPDLQKFRELLLDQPQRPPFRRGRMRPP